MDYPVMSGKYPYGAWLIRASLLDLVDEEGGSCQTQGETGFRFSLPVFGNNSTFEIELADRPGAGPDKKDCCEMTLTMRDPADTLSKDGIQRSMHYILDSVIQRIENELRLHAGS